MRLFSPERIIKVMDKLGVQEDEVITHSMVTRAIEKAQVRVENQNYDIRKHLLEYDDVVNKQREVIYGMRRDALEGRELGEQFSDFLENAVDGVLAECIDPETVPDDWDLEKLPAPVGAARAGAAADRPAVSTWRWATTRWPSACATRPASATRPSARCWAST